MPIYQSPWDAVAAGGGGGGTPEWVPEYDNVWAGEPVSGPHYGNPDLYIDRFGVQHNLTGDNTSGTLSWVEFDGSTGQILASVPSSGHEAWSAFIDLAAAVESGGGPAYTKADHIWIVEHWIMESPGADQAGLLTDFHTPNTPSAEWAYYKNVGVDMRLQMAPNEATADGFTALDFFTGLEFMGCLAVSPRVGVAAPAAPTDLALAFTAEWFNLPLPFNSVVVPGIPLYWHQWLAVGASGVAVKVTRVRTIIYRWRVP